MYAMDGQDAKPEFVFCFSFRKQDSYGKTVLNWWSERVPPAGASFDLLQQLARMAYDGQHFLKLHLRSRLFLRALKEGMQPDQAGQNIGDGWAVTEEGLVGAPIHKTQQVGEHSHTG